MYAARCMARSISAVRVGLWLSALAVVMGYGLCLVVGYGPCLVRQPARHGITAAKTFPRDNFMPSCRSCGTNTIPNMRAIPDKYRSTGRPHPHSIPVPKIAISPDKYHSKQTWGMPLNFAGGGLDGRQPPAYDFAIWQPPAPGVRA
jgi:hypothetical protein